MLLTTIFIKPKYILFLFIITEIRIYQIRSSQFLLI